MRPLYVAERALEEVETDLSEGQPATSQLQLLPAFLHVAEEKLR